MSKKMIISLLFAGFIGVIESKIPTKILICGICKDVAARIPYSINIVESIGNLFEDYRVVVYENNSTDKTAQVLRRWENINHKVTIFSENISEKKLSDSAVNICEGKPCRYELIARARNIVLDAIQHEQYNDFPYIIWLDLDFKIPPRLEGIKEVFESTQEWDAIFAYGVAPNGEFWDWFALRDKVEPFGPEIIGHAWYIPKKRNFDKNHWIPVYSAFGGCGIYKKASIEGCQYSALVTPDLQALVLSILADQGMSNNRYVLKYWNDLRILSNIVYLPTPHETTSNITDPLIGITISDDKDAVIWRMNSFTYRYPVVCEHVPFHASMIVRGHDKLYINPRMVFTYGG